MKNAEYYLSLNYPVMLQALSAEDGGGYAATIPQLGKNTFVAVGETAAEALAALDELRHVLIPHLVEQGVELPTPEKEEATTQYSGSLMLRVPRNLHAQLAAEAKRNGCSINKLATHLLTQGLTEQTAMASIREILSDAVAEGVREALDRSRAGSTAPAPGISSRRSWKINEDSIPLYVSHRASPDPKAGLVGNESGYELAS